LECTESGCGCVFMLVVLMNQVRGSLCLSPPHS
jgi:hypothetical protein